MIRRAFLTLLAAVAAAPAVRKCECGHPRHEGLCGVGHPWCRCWAVKVRFHPDAFSMEWR